MSETLMALMKKGGGSGESDFPIGENMMFKYCGAMAFGDPSIEQYSLNTNLLDGFAYNYVLACVIINCKGHTTADITTAATYDEVFAFSEDGTTTRIVRGRDKVLTDYDISAIDFIVFCWQAQASANSRQFVITN